MAKPIFVVEIPSLESKHIEEITKKLAKKMDDYHVVIYGTNEDFKCTVFYEKDFTKIELNDLKELIKNRLK